MPEILTVTLPGHKKREVRQQLRDLPGYISGRERDQHGHGSLFKAIYVQEFFKLIHEAFLKKSDGQSDQFGNRWKPLKRSTIAARPLRPGEHKKLGILGLGRGGRGLLTAQENRVWGGIFRSQFMKLAPKVGEGKAKALAAQMAWAIMKSRGAKTKLEVLGNRKVPILIDTHRLEKSLRPGQLAGEIYIPPPEQVLEVDSRSVKIGSEVPYAARQHKHRRLWPTTRQMASWATTISIRACLRVVKTIRQSS